MTRGERIGGKLSKRGVQPVKDVIRQATNYRKADDSRTMNVVQKIHVSSGPAGQKRTEGFPDNAVKGKHW